MSSTTMPPPPSSSSSSTPGIEAENAPTRLATHLFAAVVVFFLLAGLVIVLGQSVLLALGDADAARDWEETMAPWAFGGASVAGLLSFALSYGRTAEHADDDADDD